MTEGLLLAVVWVPAVALAWEYRSRIRELRADNVRLMTERAKLEAALLAVGTSPVAAAIYQSYAPEDGRSDHMVAEDVAKRTSGRDIGLLGL